MFKFNDFVCLCACLVYVVVELIPNCKVGSSPNIDLIKKEVLQGCYNLLVGVYQFLIPIIEMLF